MKLKRNDQGGYIIPTPGGYMREYAKVFGVGVSTTGIRPDQYDAPPAVYARVDRRTGLALAVTVKQWVKE